MASPVAHVLTGVAVAWAADLMPGNRTGRTAAASAPWYRRAGNGLTLICAFLAAAPDLDLLIDGFHRTVTHSVVSAIAVGLIAALVAVRARGAVPGESLLSVVRIAAMCAAAWGSHMWIDWISADQSNPNGLQILWPFSDTWFISGWDLFPGTERRRLLSGPSLMRNTEALLIEVAVMLPIVSGLWLVRIKALAGLSPQLTRRHHPTQ